MTFSATDAAGNTATAQTIVNVSLDVVDPELTVPDSVSINVDMPGDVVFFVLGHWVGQTSRSPPLVCRFAKLFFPPPGGPDRPPSCWLGLIGLAGQASPSRKPG